MVFGPFAIASGRLLIGGIVLLAIWLINPKIGKIAPSRVFKLFILSIMANMIPFSLQPYLITRLDNSAFIGMMIAFVPLFTLIAAMPLLKHKPSKNEIVGTLGGLACLAVIFSEATQQNISWGTLALATVIPLTYALSNIAIKRFFSDIHPVSLSCVELLCAGPCLLIISFIYETPAWDSPQYTRAIIALAILGAICTGIATYWFFAMIQRRGPLFASMVAYVIPFVALLWGLYFGESISTLQIIALFGVIGSIFVVNRKSTSTPPSATPPAEAT